MTSTVVLGDLCRPKQWKVLSKSQMAVAGYPVYGANGKIGYADSYTHARPTILIGCRGSCGSVHVTEPKSYANGNAMALDNLDESRVVLRFLVHFCRARGFVDVITGTSQPQIIRQNLVRVQVPLPPLDEQQRIATILDQADAVRAKRREALAHLDDLTRSIFLDMFGDPMTNPMNWPRKAIRDWGQVTTGNTPPRADESNYGPGIEWIKSDNLSTREEIATRAVESLSKKGESQARRVGPGSILVTCIAGSPGSIGNVAMVDRAVTFNQQINALTPDPENSRFLLAHLVVGKALVQEKSSGGMKGLVSKSRFGSVLLMAPPADLREEFSRRTAVIDRLHLIQRQQLADLEALFASLQSRAFEGV